jgi:hypothetical protein
VQEGLLIEKGRREGRKKRMYAMNAKEISDSSYFLTVLVKPLITIPRELWQVLRIRLDEAFELSAAQLA